MVKRSTMKPLSWQVTHSVLPTKRGGDEHESAVRLVLPVGPPPTPPWACSEPVSRALLPTWAGGLQ